MGVWFSRTAVIGRRIDPNLPSWEPFTFLTTSNWWIHKLNYTRFRRHRFGLFDIDRSLRRAMHLSERRYAYRLPAA